MKRLPPRSTRTVTLFPYATRFRSRAGRTVRLVYPAEADIAEGRMSILTPVGAGLIGLSVGQSINWPDRGGIEHRLTIVAVEQPVRAALTAMLPPDRSDGRSTPRGAFKRRATRNR